MTESFTSPLHLEQWTQSLATNILVSYKTDTNSNFWILTAV